MRYDLPYGNFPGIWTSSCDDEKQQMPYMPIDPPMCCEKQPVPCRQDDYSTPCPVQERRRDDACCEQEESAYDNRCCKQEEGAYDNRPCKQEKNRGRTPGMVYAAYQHFEGLCEPMQALRRGTLYESLHKPMTLCNDQCTRVCCTQEQVMAFTLWELRLYLNTHPHDTNALNLFNRLCRDMGKNNYACAFLPDCTRRWQWIQDPWPWEHAANCDGRGKN